MKPDVENTRRKSNSRTMPTIPRRRMIPGLFMMILNYKRWENSQPKSLLKKHLKLTIKNLLAMMKKWNGFPWMSIKLFFTIFSKTTIPASFYMKSDFNSVKLFLN